MPPHSEILAMPLCIWAQHECFPNITSVELYYFQYKQFLYKDIRIEWSTHYVSYVSNIQQQEATMALGLCHRPVFDWSQSQAEEEGIGDVVTCNEILYSHRKSN